MDLRPRATASECPTSAVASPSASIEPPLADEVGLLAHVRDLLVIMDESGRITDMSASGVEILGYTAASVVGTRILSYIHPDDRTRLRAFAPGHVVSGAAPRVDLRLRSRRGAWLPVRWTWSAPVGARIYAVGRDRSEDLRLQRDAWARERAELRLRTATELHDGVLQTLAAVSLQLEVSRRLMESDPIRAAEVLAALGEAVSAEQRELRFYVDEIKELPTRPAEGPIPLRKRVVEMLDRVQQIWGVTTALHADLAEPFDHEIERQILRLIQECVANAVRHGEAETVSIRLAQVGQELHLQIRDNGRGFPFVGAYTHEQLNDQRLGPLRVKQRVAAVRGRISIESAKAGAVVSVSLPLPERISQ